jgi:hypothetical protein
MTLSDGDVAALARQVVNRRHPELDIQIVPADRADPYRRGLAAWTVSAGAAHSYVTADMDAATALNTLADDLDRPPPPEVREARQRMLDATGPGPASTGNEDAAVARALAITPSSTAEERTVDITTVGARTLLPRTIEINFWRIDGRWYLASPPSSRSWFANLRAHPRFTFHLKNGVCADLAARAVIVTGEMDRRTVLRAITQEAARLGQLSSHTDLEEWVARSPLVEVQFDELT